VGKSAHQKIVVTVLFGNTPLCMVEIVRRGDNAADVDVYHADEAPLMDIKDALEVAYHSVGYTTWKETGIPPSPLDVERQEEIPFDFE